MKRQRLFLDSNCWFSGAVSPGGGAGVLLGYAAKGLVIVCISEKILEETARNLQNKAPQIAVNRFFATLQLTSVEFIDNPRPEEEMVWNNITVPKDCHVLAGALKADAHMLITLDRKHILIQKVKVAYPIPVMEPGDYIRHWALPAQDS